MKSRFPDIDAIVIEKMRLYYIWPRWRWFSYAIDLRTPYGVPLGPAWPQDECLGCTFPDFHIQDPEILENHKTRNSLYSVYYAMQGCVRRQEVNVPKCPNDILNNEIVSFSGERKTKFEWARKTYDFIVQHTVDWIFVSYVICYPPRPFFYLEAS